MGLPDGLEISHSGSVTSIHANDCRGALYKIGSYIKQSEVGQTLDFNYIMQEVMTTIDVVVFFEKTHLKELYFDPVKKLQLLRAVRHEQEKIAIAVLCCCYWPWYLFLSCSM
ncbi:CpaF/VirB11 family protein [Xylella fastidiosa subsp. multiplex]|uniref:CpaF/VirB11 family protein n=1 Tax=Xylella fastidiosa subsp. multiplex TaxID=644357 RepID=A0AAW6HXT3_XYLFS|nr:CpaF/VirB11 family protein [Xylella fastidiosa subsp. multiplex]